MSVPTLAYLLVSRHTNNQGYDRRESLFRFEGFVSYLSRASHIWSSVIFYEAHSISFIPNQ